MFVKETIWAQAFVNALFHARVSDRDRRLQNAVQWGYYTVQKFLGNNVQAPLTKLDADAAEAMYREMQGKEESERLRVQKEMVRGLIQYIENRIDQIARPHPNHDMDFYKLKNEVALKELRGLVGELNTMLHG